MQDHVKKNEENLFDADLDAIIKDVLTMAIATHESDNVGESCDTEHGMKATLKKMATAVALCTTKDGECKTQLGALEKQLTSQIAARKTSDSWQKKHLANATALVNLHIRNDILGDVKSADANKHMKGDVCQMQMVEHVWSIHDFVVADNRICVTGRLAALKANAESCFDDPDKKDILTHVKNMQDHVKKNEENLFDADLDAIIKDVLTMAIATHESDNVGESCDTEHGMKATLKKMATAVALCTTKDGECKTQLGALEKQLTSQIAARKTSDSWQKKHLANATALVNLHIRNDILGDVKSADANKH